MKWGGECLVTFCFSLFQFRPRLSVRHELYTVHYVLSYDPLNKLLALLLLLLILLIFSVIIDRFTSNVCTYLQYFNILVFLIIVLFVWLSLLAFLWSFVCDAVCYMCNVMYLMLCVKCDLKCFCDVMSRLGVMLLCGDECVWRFHVNVGCEVHPVHTEALLQSLFVFVSSSVPTGRFVRCCTWLRSSPLSCQSLCRTWPQPTTSTHHTQQSLRHKLRGYLHDMFLKLTLFHRSKYRNYFINNRLYAI